MIIYIFKEKKQTFTVAKVNDGGGDRMKNTFQ